MYFHHCSIRTKDIFGAIEFYEALGFTIETRFTTGSTLGCWMTGNATRLELIQIPEPHPAPECFFNPHYTGYYHVSFRVDSLEATLENLVKKLGKISLLLAPTAQTIGEQSLRVAFIADRDGLPIELMELGLHS